jgi:hypothetical protein
MSRTRPRTTARGRSAAVAAVVTLVAVTAGGCGLVPSTSDDDAPTPQSTFAQPQDDAPDDFEPFTEPPRDTREVTFAGHTLWAPAEFQQTERSGPQDVPLTVLGKPAQGGVGVCEVVAFVENDPESTAEEQMYGLAGAKELAGARDITREAVEWPDAESAVLVRWTEQTSGPQGELTQRFAQLAVQPSGSQIVSVIAVAPADEFDDCGVVDVLRTLSVGA